jgi:hypothetical protein
MVPLWAFQDVLKTNFFNPATALLVSGKKVPNALLLSPKGRIAMIVLSSIGGLFALVSATFSCWRICKRRQRSGVPSDSESPDTDGDDGEDKEQQQGLLDAGAPMGTTETAEVDKVPYTDTSFAPQLNDKVRSDHTRCYLYVDNMPRMVKVRQAIRLPWIIKVKEPINLAYTGVLLRNDYMKERSL